MDLSFLIECSAMAVAIRVVIHVSRLADASQLAVVSQLVDASHPAESKKSLTVNYSPIIQ